MLEKLKDLKAGGPDGRSLRRTEVTGMLLTFISKSISWVRSRAQPNIVFWCRCGGSVGDA